jgi:hypothetical protein
MTPKSGANGHGQISPLVHLAGSLLAPRFTGADFVPAGLAAPASVSDSGYSRGRGSGTPLGHRHPSGATPAVAAASLTDDEMTWVELLRSGFRLANQSMEVMTEIWRREIMMKKIMTASVLLLVAATTVMAAPPDQWIHVRVVNAGDKGETVRINVPMSFAEAVLPSLCAEKLREGKVKFGSEFGDVDLRAILQAVRDSPDNEFVTVEKKDESVRVSKAGGNLLIKVRQKHAGKNADNENVDVKVPLTVVQAILSGKKGELDVLAGIRALSAQGNMELVTVNGQSENVRIWTDTRNSSE